MNDSPVNVVCMKWGTKYGPEYVNILRAMVRRHLSRPHRFVCLTDDDRGIGDEVECLPLPAELYRPENIGGVRECRPTGNGTPSARPKRHPERGWMKIGMFSETLGEPSAELRGTTLFLDLDVLIVASIEAFFEHRGRFVLTHDYTWYGKRPNVGNTSVFRFEIGAHKDVVEHFMDHRGEVTRRFRNEQEYVTHRIGQSNSGVTYWPERWCPSFKRHCVPRWPLNFAVPPRIPHGAKIIVFHGRPDPPDALRGRSGKWYRRIRPAPWVAEHWRE